MALVRLLLAASTSFILKVALAESGVRSIRFRRVSWLDWRVMSNSSMLTVKGRPAQCAVTCVQLPGCVAFTRLAQGGGLCLLQAKLYAGYPDSLPPSPGAKTYRAPAGE